VFARVVDGGVEANCQSQEALNLNLPNGVYLLNVISDKATHTEMITIQN
jgi:hypothetical protein